MSDFWVKELEQAEKDKVKANFKIGWLIACLEDFMTSKEASEKLAMAQSEADRIYG